MSYAVRLMIEEVAAVTGVPTAVIMSAQRTAPVSRARAIAAYVIHEVTLWSWARIGRNLDKDHTTIIAACRRIAEARQTDTELDRMVTALIEKLKTKQREQFRASALDVVDLASPIAGGSLRSAINTSARDVRQLAEGVMELWDIALAAEVFVAHINKNLAITSDEDRKFAENLGRAITETIDEMRAPATPSTSQEANL